MQINLHPTRKQALPVRASGNKVLASPKIQEIGMSLLSYGPLVPQPEIDLDPLDVGGNGSFLNPRASISAGVSAALRLGRMVDIRV